MVNIKGELCFVQFIHPGGEHKSKKKGIISWNKSSHKRKFIVEKGTYISSTTGNKVESNLGFWSEWEPESEVDPIGNPLFNGPFCTHRPFYRLPNSYIGLQNTDPFVFGEQPHYTVCQHYRGDHPTQLRYLRRGSVILFGSYLKKEFVLDTVFVVDHWIDYDKVNFMKQLKGKVSGTYMNVTILPLSKKDNLRLYFGATFDNKVNEMFSFFPTQPIDKYPNGFARPKIGIPDIITDDLMRGFKLNRQDDIDNMYNLWSQVVGKILKSGLHLGIKTELPLRL
jgi:hypothetical protein